MQSVEIVRGILDRHDLKEPDGRALYAYRVTDEETQQLGQALQSELQNRTQYTSRAVCGAFCLFAAEWFCRNHTEGRWKWERIFADGLQLDGDVLQWALQNNNRTQMAQRGLLWWKTPLVELEGSRRFLASVVCQGGLPLRTLRMHGSALNRFLTSVLRQQERFPTRSMGELIEEKEELLPQSLQNDVVYDLSHKLLSAVVQLRAAGSESETDGPARVRGLDLRYPRWRNQIPLRIGDRDAEALLLGLLETETADAGVRLPEIQTELQWKQNGEFSLFRHLAGPAELSEDALVRLANQCDASLLAGQMRVVLMTDRHEEVVARLLRTRAEKPWRLICDRGGVRDDKAIDAIWLELDTGSPTRLEAAVAGGEALDHDLPWVFAAENPGELLGVGRVRTRRTCVRVCLPREASLRLIDAAGEPKHLGITLGERDVFEVSDSCEVLSNGERFSVQCGQAVDDSFRLQLQGRRQQLGFGGDTVFCGMPEIIAMDEMGFCRRLERRSIEVQYLQRGAALQIAGDNRSCGKLVYRIRENDELVSQIRGVVVPADFRCQIRPDAGGGRIVLQSSRLREVHVQAAGLLQTSVERLSGRFEIWVSLSGAERPESVLLLLLFDNGDELSVRVGNPTVCAQVVNVLGDQVGAQLAVEQFHQMSLRVTSASRSIPTVELRQQDRELLARMRPAKGGETTFELPLSVLESRIRAILASRGNLDDTLQLQVMQGAFGKPLLSVTIQQYYSAAKPTYSADELGQDAFADVEIPAKLAEELDLKHHELRLELCPMGRPLETLPEHVTEIEFGVWRVATGKLPQGPYLATVFIDNGFKCLRPVLLNARRDDSLTLAELPEEPDLAQVVQIVDRSDRIAAIDSFLKRMQEQPLSGVWVEEVKPLLEACYVKPMATFDVIARLAANTRAATVLSIYAGQGARFWERMQHLPFLWSLIPIRDWVLTAEQWYDTNCSLFPDELGHELLQNSLRGELSRWLGKDSRKPESLNCAGLIVEFILQQKLGNVVESDRLAELLPNSQEKHCQTISDARQGLITRFNLLDEHGSRDFWPRPRLFAWDLARKQFARYRSVWAAEPEYFSNQVSVLNAPLVAAYCSVCAVDVPAENRAPFQVIRGIDDCWFDSSFSSACFLLAGQQLAQDPGFFQSNEA